MNETIEITNASQLRAGDQVELVHDDGDTYSGRVAGVGFDGMMTPLRFVSGAKFTVGGGDAAKLGKWKLARATRERWRPGTAGTATVKGVPGIWVVRTEEADYPWWSLQEVGDGDGYTEDHLHVESVVSDFVPDDVEKLGAELREARRMVAEDFLCPHGETAGALCNRLPDDRTLAGMHRLWAYLTVSEQASWIDERVVPTPPSALQGALPTQERVAEAIRGDRTRVRDAMRAAGAPEVRIMTSPALHCVEPMDAASDVLALFEQVGKAPTVQRERLRDAIGGFGPEVALEHVVMVLRVAGIGVEG